ncbi:hypothetical protein BZG02_02990 [Labilibaculum filiforme]|uniref:Uncharacterized protein n=1 Tax=Labilibaculum filiforme TaxID=1940526 RepID=A0A2N3I3F0_9BACT|nr:DUF6261 family protein [Labilibaculum filiforme]PKQ64832.1 hypothetical protein BZG02_02990 [Labilibaculum filiforme]
MIPKLSYKTRTTEVNSTSENLGLTYKKQNIKEDNYLTDLFTNLQNKSDLLRTAINRSKAESNLDAKDVMRDEKVQALYYLLLGAMHNPNAAISAPAAKLYDVFIKYGLKMTQKSYMIESSLVESMLEDYEAVDLQADIAAVLGCAELIAHIETAQNDFKTANIAWEEAKSKEGLTVSATKIKKEIITFINDNIVVYLKAMNLAKNAVYGELAQNVSQIINDTNQSVKRRTKMGEEVVAD